MLTGDNSLRDKLRLATSIELYCYADFYASHPVFDSIKNKFGESFPSVRSILNFSVSHAASDIGSTNLKNIVETEAIINCNDKKWCGFLCCLGLSSVLGCSLITHYPDHDLKVIKWQQLFNQTIKPWEPEINFFNPIDILFCYEGMPPINT